MTKQTRPSKKSKLPDFNEVFGIANKLFTDLKKSLGEIVKEYKAKHTEEPDPEHKHKPHKHETKNKH